MIHILTCLLFHWTIIIFYNKEWFFFFTWNNSLEGQEYLFPFTEVLTLSFRRLQNKGSWQVEEPELPYLLLWRPHYIDGSNSMFLIHSHILPTTDSKYLLTSLDSNLHIIKLTWKYPIAYSFWNISETWTEESYSFTMPAFLLIYSGLWWLEIKPLSTSFSVDELNFKEHLRIFTNWCNISSWNDL